MDLQRPVAPHPYEILPTVPSFPLTSPDISEGEPMDSQFVADGQNTSPTLIWSDLPEGTEGLLVTCFDPDAPTPAGYWHWTVTDLDSSVSTLEQGAGESDLSLPGAAFHLRTDGGAFAYEGAAPPPGDRAHRYVFAVHALDVPTLELTSEDSATKASFLALFHTLGRGTLTATYQR
ncbi:YbhB/YbcL family Raf kinase inhibitor-like protein [Ruania rhizosphaerae]|uniref:YbhB/YbcL family Raf kinase inhibitor-like protein n=1 Tax=Ruania rhizosphaerae TaxID=1840413 RepID=UPI00135A5C81|nr:YbhB/YbcL family Raf kinase inhibitor-like protein [Ruania rhizosphaerae]